jgi:hypothetical protein
MTANDSHGTSGPGQTEGRRIRPRDETDELRENIAHTRGELGATVAALAQKADVKARAKDKAAQMRSNVATQARHAAEMTKDKAGHAGHQARETVSHAAAPAARRGAAVAVVGAGAGTVALWVRRRRRARKPTKWQLALQTGRQMYGKAADLAATSRWTATSPAAKPVAAATAVAAVAVWRRRRRKARRQLVA